MKMSITCKIYYLLDIPMFLALDSSDLNQRLRKRKQFIKKIFKIHIQIWIENYTKYLVLCIIIIVVKFKY